MTESEVQEVERRLRVAYCEALKVAHGYARVSVHIGTDVAEHLKSLMPEHVRHLPARTFFGFPVVVELALPPDHISVHTVSTIH